MHLVTVEGSPRPWVGALVGNHVLDLAAAAKAVEGQAAAGAPALSGMLELIQAGPAGLGTARAALAHAQAALGVDAAGAERQGLARPRDRVRLLAPIPRPAKNIFCLGRTSAAHAAERGSPAPTIPVYFTKPYTTVIGPEAEIVYHRSTKELDYEVELTVVIGTAGRNIPKERALSHVFGYTIMNDLSCREVQQAERKEGNICIGKNFPTAAPLGPWIVTKDEIPDPHNLRLVTRVNGEVRQNGNTANQIYRIPAQIAWYSHAGFEPGDLISSGTPAGTATGYKGPGTWYLQHGDRVECEIEGIGVLANTVSTRKRKG